MLRSTGVAKIVGPIALLLVSALLLSILVMARRQRKNMPQEQSTRADITIREARKNEILALPGCQVGSTFEKCESDLARIRVTGTLDVPRSDSDPSYFFDGQNSRDRLQKGGCMVRIQFAAGKLVDFGVLLIDPE